MVCVVVETNTAILQWKLKEIEGSWVWVYPYSCVVYINIGSVRVRVLFRAEIPGFAGIIPAEFRAFFLPPKFTGIGIILRKFYEGLKI